VSGVIPIGESGGSSPKVRVALELMSALGPCALPPAVCEGPVYRALATSHLMAFSTLGGQGESLVPPFTRGTSPSLFLSPMHA
jgi:hypothetical protein